ncbi:MAG: Calx-beta domain-containing protein, partial [Gammaproteobacteria bacterium]
MNLKSFRQNRLFHSFIWLASVVLIPTSANAAIAFTDATTDAGGFNAGERWGASWGDINGDGRPDLYVNNHRIMPSLYRNNGDGTFTEVAQEVDISKTWITTPKEDLHGATWVDFDNDGDDDLYVSVSVGNDSQFMVNTDGVFTNKSVSAGLIGHTESRMPIWLDYSGDGYLDVIDMSTVAVVNKQDPATGTFSVDTSTGLSCTKRMNYGQLVDLNNNGSMEFLCINEGLFPQKIYDTATVPFTDVTYLVPKAYNVNDTITADFNNDLLTDMFLTRGRLRPNQALIINNKRIEAWLDTLNKTELGFNFESNGIVTFNLDSRIKKSVNIAHIFYGSNGLNPADINFSLDPANADVAGIKPDRTAWGYYIGYNTTIQKWEVFYKPETDGRVYITVDTEATVSNLEATGLKNIDLPMSPQLLMNSASGLSFDTNAGVGIPVSCVSAATGDFDNDMDVDLYLVCRGGVENLPNILYENNNDGTFSPVALAGGAEGLVGAGLSSGAGTGESVVVADYNLDGFLDLFVTNGLLMRPFGLGGSDQLFQNNANSNRWIELDLQGTNSNRNGIGAKVIVTAGGIKQLREQNGGYHRWSQNHQRLHFGLGTNSVIENIEILWPNGQTTQHTDVDTNKLYTATEDGLLTERVLGDPSGPAIQKDDECGPPTYSAGTNRGFYLWKDCATSSWLVRIPGGNNNNIIRYTGSIKSSTQFVSTTPISLESGDSLDDTDPLSIEFDFTVSGSSEDGFNFNIPTNNFCLTLDTPQNMTVYLGAKTRSIRTPFNLETLQHCGAATSSSLSIGQAVVINEGSGSASFTVTLDSPATTPVTVSYATADITAQSGQDYTSTSGTLTIPASSTSASIQVPVTDDSLVEGDEEFSINLSNPTGASIGVASSFATITDNDTSALTANNVSAAENTASVDIAVTLSTASNQVITVDYSTTDGTATAGNDYVSQSGTLTFNAGDTSKTISVNLTDDSLSEGPESFSVTLSSPSNATIEKASATVSLTDNEASACGEPAYDAATEKGIYLWKDCSTQLWSIRTLGGGSSSALKYKGAISSNQAISNVAGFSIEASDIYDNSTNSLQLDFLMRMQGAGVDGGSFTLASGASACLEITSAPSGSTVYIGSARTAYTAPIDLSTLGSCAVTPEISIADASVSETANSVDLTVSLSVASTQTISVNYATSDNTATAGNDYVAN